MGSDKLTKKLGQFIACGALATAGMAFAADVAKVEPVKVAPVVAVTAEKTAQPPVQAEVNKTKIKAHAKKVKKVTPGKSTDVAPKAPAAPVATPSK
jgi:acetaldehyde dehydrogenase (acetylating)